jgi:hypothetical protein
MRRIIFAFVLLGIVTGVKAQDKTLYFMNRVPQSSFLNPSTTPQFSYYIGFPGLSGVGFSFNSSSFSFVDAFNKDGNRSIDSLRFDVNGLEKKLGKVNFIRVESSIDLLSFGFKQKDYYWHFNISSKSSLSNSYPKELINVKYGNYDAETGKPRTINLSDAAANGFTYIEQGIGVSKVLDEKLTLGARFKVLSGIAGVKTSRFKSNIVTSEDFQKSTINVDAEMLVSSPRLAFRYDSEGKIDGVYFGDGENNRSNSYRFGSNLGLGVDFGGTYKYDNRYTFYASINDIGFIRWSKNGYKLTSRGAFEYNGADITPDENGNVDFNSAMKSIVDTLKSKFKPTDKSAKFTTMLNSKIYLGATYNTPISWLNCGALLHGGFYGTYFDPSLTFSANATPYRAFAFSLSYSIYNRRMDNFGFGIVVGEKPVQFYFAADNIIFRFVRLKWNNSSSAIIPGYSRSFNFQFGLNLQFDSWSRGKGGSKKTCSEM